MRKGRKQPQARRIKAAENKAYEKHSKMKSSSYKNKKGR